MGNKSEDLNQLVLSTLSKTTKLPFVKVSREEFLRKEFKGSEYLAHTVLKSDPGKTSAEGNRIRKVPLRAELQQ